MRSVLFMNGFRRAQAAINLSISASARGDLVLSTSLKNHEAIPRGRRLSTLRDVCVGNARNRPPPLTSSEIISRGWKQPKPVLGHDEDSRIGPPRYLRRPCVVCTSVASQQASSRAGSNETPDSGLFVSLFMRRRPPSLAFQWRGVFRRRWSITHPSLCWTPPCVLLPPHSFSLNH